MRAAILHHAGDGNAPPVRVRSTVNLVSLAPLVGINMRVFIAVDGPEARELVHVLGAAHVTVCAGATDTLSEIARTMPDVLAWGATVLYSSTEPGHVDRATICARILYWRRGVHVFPAPSAPGTYRAPWYLLPRDVVRALWLRATMSVR